MEIVFTILDNNIFINAVLNQLYLKKPFNLLTLRVMIRDKPTVSYVDDLPLNLKLVEATLRNNYRLILAEFFGNLRRMRSSGS